MAEPDHTFWKRDNGSFGMIGHEICRVKQLQFYLDTTNVIIIDIRLKNDEEGLIYLTAEQAMKMANALRNMAIKAFEEENLE